ncbi:hypothetical protein [Paracoccus marcusii]|uniref:Uncharacterized protein n=1 Tax=Paracoccus marcusii TaxID=59779 RepID=A0ABY7UW39_9RHOB|nr:hypothetical protein [Paracoccus marcusii]WDA13646.1 hypothetical protein PRL19_05165 [Paracoccus marcusii]
MFGIPIAAILAIVGIFITANYQRRHWLRATHEEIRTRETREANDLLRDIARIFDKRIACQRLYLLNLEDENSSEYKKSYMDSVKEYSGSYNDLRYRLRFYTSYASVLDFEKTLNDRIVKNGNRISTIAKLNNRSESEVSEIDKDLSIISAKVFEFCARLANKISAEDFGSLRKLSSWNNPSNEYITNWWLIKRLLNI